jgi:O-antigen biosynthesis protein WbqP
VTGEFYRREGKRALDAMLAGLALLVLAPIMALVALAVRLEDGGPALFRQQRTGRGGAVFTLFKFRSMPPGSANLPSTQATHLQVTRVGAILRRTNLDELPQLFNILRGDMSIVGPRPALPSQSELLVLRGETGAAACRPGLTGLAQIRAYEGMPIAEKSAHDGEYARRMSLWLDLTISVRTIGYLFRRPPVY